MSDLFMKSKNTFLSVMVLSFVFSFFGRAGDIKGTVILKGKKSNANAVIYIDRIEGKKFKPPSQAAVMDQKNLEFIPHILPVLVGTEVEFRNSDDVLHNVYSPDACPEKFDLGSWPRGKVKTRKFDKPGCDPVILCNVHPAMEAYVVVLETPYFSVSKKDGSYLIGNVPAGTYTLKIWHERFPGKSVEARVPDKGAATVNFELSPE
jgi:plastocyanin